MFNAIYAAQHPQNFLFNAQASGNIRNPLAHAILRGGLDASGKNIPNYHYEDLLAAAKRYSEMGLQHPSSWWIPTMTILANNSKSKYVERNHDEPCLEQGFGTLVRGFLIESYLEDGRQIDSGLWSIHHRPLALGKTQAFKEIATMNK